MNLVFLDTVRSVGSYTHMRAVTHAAVAGALGTRYLNLFLGMIHMTFSRTGLLNETVSLSGPLAVVLLGDSQQELFN